MVLDSQQNYVNHGYWKFYLPNGRVAAQAYFEHGKKIGAWSRWVTLKENPVLAQAPFNQFKQPFLTTFHYDNDQLQGAWKLTDSANRTVFEIHLRNGKRHSTCTWYLVNGQKFQEIQYDSGLIHGSFRQWNIQKQLVQDRKFDQGREQKTVTEFYRPGVKRLEYGVLAGKIEPVSLDDPWNVKFAIEKKTGTDQKNGPVASWYANGQLQLQGSYEKDQQDGTFVWYYPNGQKKAVGTLEKNLRQGTWVWWHENGMRASTGTYVAGKPAGNWQWWSAAGKLSRTQEFPTVSEQPLQNASFSRNGKSATENKGN